MTCQSSERVIQMNSHFTTKVCKQTQVTHWNYRLVNGRDLVTSVPPRTSPLHKNFYHHSTEVCPINLYSIQ